MKVPSTRPSMGSRDSKAEKAKLIQHKISGETVKNDKCYNTPTMKLQKKKIEDR